MSNSTNDAFATAQRAEIKLGDVWGDPAITFTHWGYADRSHGLPTPQVDPDFLLRRDNLADFYLAVRGAKLIPQGIAMVGPVGVGKSSFVRQFYGLLNIPLESCQCCRETDPGILFGGWQLVDGDMIWVDGPVARAAKRGLPVLIEEFHRLKPDVAGTLSAFMEVSPEGQPTLLNPADLNQQIVVRPGFQVILTGNTLDGIDETGQIQGAFLQDASFINRVHAVEVEYISRDDAIDAVQRRLKSWCGQRIDQVIAERMHRVMEITRDAFQNANLSDRTRQFVEHPLDYVMTQRDFLRWAGAAMDLQGGNRYANASLAAFKKAVSVKTRNPTRDALDRIAELVLNEPVASQTD